MVDSICPISKKGDRHDVSNNWPISILNSIPKLFEKLVTPPFTSFMKPLLADCQHGFTYSKSTLSNLTVTVPNISDALDKGGQVNVVYTDFAKAFDKVPHFILIEKLASLGIANLLLCWFSDYLTTRENW